MGKNDRTAFYDAFWEALSGYFGNRLNLPPGSVTASRVLDAFDSAGDELKNEIRRLFSICDAQRFGLRSRSPADRPDNLQDCLQDLDRLLKDCERMNL